MPAWPNFPMHNQQYRVSGANISNNILHHLSTFLHKTLTNLPDGGCSSNIPIFSKNSRRKVVFSPIQYIVKSNNNTIHSPSREFSCFSVPTFFPCFSCFTFKTKQHCPVSLIIIVIVKIIQNCKNCQNCQTNEKKSKCKNCQKMSSC